jgi:hypothetical protein
MKHLEEKQISREEIFKGVALHVVKDEILLPNGKRSVREISLHNGAAAVIPILPDGRVVMERQYRYAHGRVMLEIPAGKLDTPDEIPIINGTGNSGLAKGGSGDVLAGIIASFLAQGTKPHIASALGVYLHGLCGDIAAKRLSEYSLIASDIIDALPIVLNSIR